MGENRKCSVKSEGMNRMVLMVKYVSSSYGGDMTVCDVTQRNVWMR